MSNLIPATIGPYELESELGRGSMATVYRAYQPQLGRWVAIKVLDRGGEEFLHRFRQEARAVAALRHPNILTVHDYGEQDNHAYLVMEYVAGGTLRTNFSKLPLNWPDAIKLILPIGRALAYAHSQQILHRDVKPVNILMPQPDWPLLADFGLVKLLHDQTKSSTNPGVILGTPAYSAPEQFLGQKTDYRSDVYSLGVILYELVTGIQPLVSDSIFETIQRRLNQLPDPPSLYAPNLPPQVARVILKALAKDLSGRYQTMDDFVAAMAQLDQTDGNNNKGSTNQATMMLDKGTAVTGPRLVILGTGVALPLSAMDPNILGRFSTHGLQPNAINLDLHGGGQAGVSRRHARIYQNKGQWFVEDLNSTNGTFVDEQLVKPSQPTLLTAGCEIRCSRLTLIFYQ